MEFRDYAAKEAGAVLNRLLAGRTEASLQQIRALREAVETAARAAEAAAEVGPDVDAELQELVRRLNNAATAAVRANAQRIQDDAAGAMASVQGDLAAERTRVEELSVVLAEAQTQVDALRADLRDATQRAAIAERDLAAARARADEIDAARLDAESHAREQEAARIAIESELIAVRGSLDQSIAEAAKLSVERADLESAVAAAAARAREAADARDAVEHELLHIRRSRDEALAESARLSTQLEEAAAERGTLDAEVAALRAELVDLRATLAGVEAERDVNRASVVSLEQAQLEQASRIRDLESQLDAATVAEASVRTESAESVAALAGSRAQVNELHNALDRLASLLDASVLAADELAAAGSIADVLAALVRQLAVVYSRVALFRLKGNRLEGERQIGFDLSTDVTKLVIPLSVDSLIARAAASGTMESLSGAALDDSRHAPFGTSASAALAIPIVVGTETLAVLYAEEPASEGGEGAPIDQHATFARLLVRHAVALLGRLAQELRALSELREYATMLLQEAEQMHAADSEAGKPEEELRRRLQDTIACARELFAQRAAMDGPGAAALFDDQIHAAIESQAGTPFARDLAAVTGTSEPAGRAAEAS